MKATAAFDCVGGELISVLSDVLPKHAEIYVYGNLSQSKTTEISPGNFIFKGQSVEGL